MLLVSLIHFSWTLRDRILPLTLVHSPPQVGHLHSGCAKDILLTLKSSAPITLKAQPIKCRISKIAFQLPADQVPDWDDRLHTVKWVDITKSGTTTRPTKKKVRHKKCSPVGLLMKLERSKKCRFCDQGWVSTESANSVTIC